MESNLKLLEKWAHIFEMIGNTDRLAILFALHGSIYTQGEKCLTFTEIKNILGFTNDSNLHYHIGKLIDADLVKRMPNQDIEGKSRAYPLFSVTEKWKNFITESGVGESFEKFAKEWEPS